MIKFSCHWCKSSLEASAKEAETIIDCPACRKQIRVPTGRSWIKSSIPSKAVSFRLLAILLSIVSIIYIGSWVVSSLREDHRDREAANRPTDEKSAQESANEQAASSSRREKILSLVRALTDSGMIYSIDRNTRTVRVNDGAWNECDVGNKQTFVNALADYMEIKTGTGVVYVLSSRNDSELGRKGPWGGISISR